MSELAKRAIACKHWRWMPGMRGVDTVNRKWRRVGDSWAGEGHAVRTCRGEMLPDLTDPATLGCLLALVREAYDDERAHVRPAAGGWDFHTLDPMAPRVTAPTEAHCLIAALEAAP